MEDVDLSTADYFDSNELVDDPYPYFEHLRSQCPVQREPHRDVVMITGYEELTSVFADPERFSSCIAAMGPFAQFPVPLEGDDVSDVIEQYRYELPMGRELVSLDEPEHQKMRGLAMRNFTPKRMTELEPLLRDLADDLIDSIAERGGCEFMIDFAGRYSLFSICGLLGVPEADYQMFLEEIPLGPQRDRGVGRIGTGTQANPFGFLHERFTNYIEERRAEPGDDVLTSIANATFPDGSLPDVMDTVRVASILFAAGTGTTTHMLGFAVRELAERPDVQEQLRAEPDGIPNFIEEILRYNTSIKGPFRMARVSTSVGGVDIPAGSTMMLLTAAANRDPAMFEDPNEFHADRENARRHLAFGHGKHLCAGASLARAEGRVAVGRLLERLSDIRIDEAQHGPAGDRRWEYTPSFIARGLEELHVTYEVAS